MRIIQLSEPDAYRVPDLIWDGLTGDLALNGADHPDAPGDLRAGQGLATQVLILLMTDRAVTDGELRTGDINRGWLGDSFDLEPGEAALGSRLWILIERAALTEGLEQAVADEAVAALQPLIEQRVAARAEAVATANRAQNRLDLALALYGRDGSQAYHVKFSFLWEQIDGVAHPLAR